MKVSEMQRRLAQKATDAPEHRFTNLYDLLTWQPLMEWAFDKLMTNRGSRTAGIDGKDKRAALRNREQILAELRTALKAGTYRHQPVRRVYIPKGKSKRRPLGIPTLVDRLVQMMVKAILEPIFESDFLPISHGFRPELSCHTAMAQLYRMVALPQLKAYWVIEGDITSCFDRVQHKTLMRLLKRRIQDRKLSAVIWQMLKAGIMEGRLFKKTTAGVPQGGVISPLLANVYLHELDKWLQENYVGLSPYQKRLRRQRKQGNASYLRYADDFVVVWNGPKSGAIKLKAELGEFLQDHLGLELSTEKTHITHVTQGFDFLGFTVRRAIDRSRGYNQVMIYPSKASVMKVKRKIKAMTHHGTTLASVRDKITALNLLLRGWSNYFRHCNASRTFSYIGHYAFKRMERWLRKKTGQRVSKVYRKYYQRHDGYLTWVSEGAALYNPALGTRIRYLRYKHRPNPYLDVDKEVRLPCHLTPYPGRRNWQGYHSYGERWTAIREEVRNRDGYCCRICGSNQRIEVHHIRRHKPQRKHDPKRLITLCADCHRRILNPRSEACRRLNRLQLEAGEPCEGKLSRTVREGA
jgi:RNA-directed DNA polymerase